MRGKTSIGEPSYSMPAVQRIVTMIPSVSSSQVSLPRGGPWLAWAEAFRGPMPRLTNICVVLAVALMLYSTVFMTGPMESHPKPVQWKSQAEVEEVIQAIREPRSMQGGATPQQPQIQNSGRLRP